MNRIILLATLIFSLQAFAQPGPSGAGRPGGPPSGGKGPRGNPACVAVRAACEKIAGGGNRQKLGECMSKFAAGEKPKGLDMKASDPNYKACVEHVKRMLEMRKGRGGGGGPGGGGPGGRMGMGPGGGGGPGGPGMGNRPPGPPPFGGKPAQPKPVPPIDEGDDEKPAKK